MFTNDEDLLGYFRSDPLGETVFDIKTWDNIYQTILRNKMNMIVPGTTPYPDEKSLKLANRRGLIISQSHWETVGYNADAWTKIFGM